MSINQRYSGAVWEFLVPVEGYETWLTMLKTQIHREIVYENIEPGRCYLISDESSTTRDFEKIAELTLNHFNIQKLHCRLVSKTAVIFEKD